MNKAEVDKEEACTGRGWSLESARRCEFCFSTIAMVQSFRLRLRSEVYVQRIYSNASQMLLDLHAFPVYRRM